MTAGHALRAIGWLVVKDLQGEIRVRRAWLGMLLLGFIFVVLLEMESDLPLEWKQQVMSGLIWLVLFFAGTLSLEGSFATEREQGCWRALRLCPLPPSVVFAAKVVVNLTALAILECTLAPALSLLANVPITDRLLPLVLIAALSNLGFCALGVLVTALTMSLAQKRGVLALVLLPMMIPVIIGAAEATRLVASGDLGAVWWRWIQLLAVFAVLFSVLGTLVFEFVIED
jgi:heme exporter protein B